jgi:hypothetical protein
VLEEEFSDVVIVVIERDHQRSRAFGRRQVDVRTCVEKRFDASQTAAARCVEQRSQTAVSVILRSRL